MKKITTAERKAAILRIISERGRVTWADLDPTQLTIQRWQKPMGELVREGVLHKCEPQRTTTRRVFFELAERAA